MDREESAGFIREKLEEIKRHKVDLHAGCVACHTIFSLKEKLVSSEQDAADLLSEVLPMIPCLTVNSSML